MRELAVRHTCEVCRSAKATELHHKYYWKSGKRILGFEKSKDVVAICRPCHERLERRRKFLKAIKTVRKAAKWVVSN